MRMNTSYLPLAYLLTSASTSTGLCNEFNAKRMHCRRSCVQSSMFWSSYSTNALESRLLRHCLRQHGMYCVIIQRPFSAQIPLLSLSPSSPYPPLNVAISSAEGNISAYGDSRQFRSLEKHVDGCVRLVKHDFLLVFYGDLKSTVVEL